MTKKQKKLLIRIIIAAAMLIADILISKNLNLSIYIKLPAFLIPYFASGYDVLIKSIRNIVRGQVFDENFLMSVATVGAFFTSEFSEAVFVMLFYQVGELFQSIAVGKSRKSISELMDICPESASVLRDGEAVTVSPEEIEIGEILIVRPGEKIAVDGVIIEGETMLDTSSLTGESMPYAAKVGDEVLSGTINSASLIKVRAKKVFGQSAVSKILDLVENASSKKAKTENFITGFAKIYTPVVVVLAVIIAVVPSLITGRWGDFVHRAMMFLVISCPCALVISVPLAYFAGIGGASSKGILVKGSNYLEALAAVKTVVFDKTGTLTKGTFGITKISPAGTDEASLLKLAASAEKYSTHPVALSVSGACEDVREPESVREISGKGVVAVIDGKTVVCGNAALMRERGVEFIETYDAGTVLYVAENGKYLGSIIVSDEIKPDSMAAISKLRQAGIGPVMLTGDKKSAAEKVADALGISEYHAELLPDEKVGAMEKIMEDGRGKTAFVGDGINDAPVLMRADVGIAMGALGSDAAIEAADIVLTDDKPSKIHTAIKIARKTSAIVKENIAFALAVKITVLALGAFGVMQEMGLAVFADVGVALIAILNSMRAMKIKNA